jgi:hypothetical protein
MKQSFAQALYVIDPISPASQLPAHDGQVVAEHLHEVPLEVKEPGEIEIIVEELPGAPAGTKDPEPILEVMEEYTEEKEDTNETKKSDNGKKWDGSGGSDGFVAWIKSRLASVPKHKGDNIGGCERACSYLEKLDNDISKHMREDLDGILDDNLVEKVRVDIDESIARLQARLDKIKKSKKPARKKKAYEIDEDGFVKEAQKITGVQGTFVTVPLLISSIGRTIINGMVSAGHDAEDMMKRQIAKYKLNDREQLELRQYLFDSGMAMKVDLGRSPDEDIEFCDDKGFAWQTNYIG